MGARTSAVMYAAFIAVASTAAADEASVQQQLLDRAQIEELVTRYGTALDTRDADMYAGVFAEDAVYELPGNVVHRGRAAIRKVVTDLQESRARNDAAGKPSPSLYHPMFNHSIELIDATHARHHCYAQTVRAAEGVQFVVGFMGRYDDELVKQGGRWYIQSRKLVSFVQ